MHDRTPEAAGIQHVGLIHAAELPAALHGRLEADAANALDLVLRVGHGVHRLLLAVFQRVSLVLAEIDAADELTHDDEVDALGHDLGLEGAGRGQLGPDPGRAVVGVEAHPGAETEQTLFGALLTGQGKPEKRCGFLVGHVLCFRHNAFKDRAPDNKAVAACSAFLFG